MKIKILIGVAILAVASLAAFVVSGDGTKVGQEQMETMRGTEAYYSGATPMIKAEPYGEGDIIVNLDDPTKILTMKFDVSYRVGMEWRDDPQQAETAFADRASEIRSRLIILLRGKTPDQIQGANVVLLQEEILQLIDEVAFPKRRARVDKVLIKNLLIQ